MIGTNDWCPSCNYDCDFSCGTDNECGCGFGCISACYDTGCHNLCFSDNPFFV